ncbi:hypothetical protein IAR50_006179 [Cryptococcus sp. DSM 104548]
MTAQAPVFKLFIVRHGRTTYNSQSVIQGKLDIPLSAYGIAQASQSTSLFSDIPIHGAITSTLLRAKQTADIILEEHIGVEGEARVEDERLDERGMGRWEGKNADEVRWEEEPEDAETFDAVNIRVASFLTSLLASFGTPSSKISEVDTNNILLVTHEDVITSFARLFSGKARVEGEPEWQIGLGKDVELIDGCGNLGVGTVEGFIEGDRWVLRIRGWASEGPVV